MQRTLLTKKKAYRVVEIICNHIPSKGPVPRIYKVLLGLINKKTTQF
jgi:hypothetical protein